MVSKQTEANRRWREKNKEHARYLNERTKARAFLRNKATDEDLDAFVELIEVERNKRLEEDGTD